MSYEDWYKRLWVVEAPPGIWSSGPDVVWDIPDQGQSILEQYNEMGWTIKGPYVLEEDPL